MNLDPLVNKTVEFAFAGARLRLELSHALFSSFDIDQGTRLLLKALAREPRLAAESPSGEVIRVLDSGCGVGVIGLAVAKAFPRTRVVMRDRDLLAVAFAERNRELNGIPAERAVTEPGLLPVGPGEAEDRFDVIVSNLPAKAGPEILGAFVRASRSALLLPGGILAFVIVHTLAAQARGWCEGAGFSSWTEEEAKGHSVFVCRAAETERTNTDEGTDNGAPADRVSYIRSEGEFEVGGRKFGARGYKGLDEFDTVGFGTESAVAAAQKAAAGCLVRHALVVEPGIGLSALWIRGVLGPDRITVASRDILSLEAATANLVGSGMPREGIFALSSLELDAMPDASCDLQIRTADEIPLHDWTVSAWSDIFRLSKKGSAFVMVCSPQGASRFARRPPKGMRILGERRKKGFAAIFGRREA